jgi:hypothetical protein
MEEIEKKPSPNLYKMFGKPSAQFELIDQNPRIWIPLLIITIIYILATTTKALLIRVEDLMLPGMTMEEGEFVLATAKAFVAISGFFIPIFSILIQSFVLYIIIKIFKKSTTFKQLFSMNTYISIISAMGLLVNNVLFTVTDGNNNGYLMTSLSGMFNNQSSILGSIELFSIWEYILIAIGLQKVGKLSKSVSILIIILFFLFRIGVAWINTTLSTYLGF